MAVKKTVQLGNPIIRAKSTTVKNISSKEVQSVIADLTDSMRAHGLVGMAAPQAGKNLRVIVTEVRKTVYRTSKEIDPLRVYINPRITWHSKREVSGWEGCGSVANAELFARVKRPQSIEVEALDENGEKFSMKTSGVLARVIQHEIDHLDGVVFTDKADSKTFMSREEYLHMKDTR